MSVSGCHWSTTVTDTGIIEGQVLLTTGPQHADYLDPVFLDNIFGLKNFSDPTKVAHFSCAAFLPGSVHTYILPPLSGTIALVGQVIELRTSDPVAPLTGQLWLRTDLT